LSLYESKYYYKIYNEHQYFYVTYSNRGIYRMVVGWWFRQRPRSSSRF